MDASVEAAPAPEPEAAELMRIRYVRNSKTAFPTGDPCDARAQFAPTGLSSVSSTARPSFPDLSAQRPAGHPVFGLLEQKT